MVPAEERMPRPDDPFWPLPPESREPETGGLPDEPDRRGTDAPEKQESPVDRAVNLNGAGAQRLRAAYKQYLGRDASDDEIRNWLSGSYGWGTGEGGVDAMIQGISTSGEAEDYRRRTTTTTPTTKTTPTPTSTPTVSGVPASYRSSGGVGAAGGGAPGATSPIGGSVPTLAEAAAQAKQLFGSAPEILKPGTFTPPPPVGLEDRNKIVQAILAQPDVMGQTFQDQLFEQQKEQQAQLAEQARARLSQATAARGLSAMGGQELLGQAGVEEGFINSLLSARRDVSMKAAEANRASRTAAVEMADAVTQGDFARAQAAYQTQLQANQIYNQLQMQAAELERGNVALVAQNLLAQREMALGEQGQSFDQYLRQLQLNEMIRQFNEQLALDYGKFGWTQKIGVASLFP
jgi:hypothetical protein